MHSKKYFNNLIKLKKALNTYRQALYMYILYIQVYILPRYMFRFSHNLMELYMFETIDNIMLYIGFTFYPMSLFLFIFF